MMDDGDGEEMYDWGDEQFGDQTLDMCDKVWISRTTVIEVSTTCWNKRKIHTPPRKSVHACGEISSLTKNTLRAHSSRARII